MMLDSGTPVYRPSRGFTRGRKRYGAWSRPPLRSCATVFIFGNQTLGRAAPPRLLEDVAEVGGADPGQADQHGGIAAIVSGGEERRGIGLHPEVALVVTAFDHECLAILPQTREELSTDPEPRRTVARSLLDPRKRQGQAPHRRQGLRDSSGHWMARVTRQRGQRVQYRTPVTTRTACAKLLVGECVRQARAADAVRINDVKRRI